jgi:hypothetical protein
MSTPTPPSAAAAAATFLTSDSPPSHAEPDIASLQRIIDDESARDAEADEELRAMMRDMRHDLSRLRELTSSNVESNVRAHSLHAQIDDATKGRQRVEEAKAELQSVRHTNEVHIH